MENFPVKAILPFFYLVLTCDKMNEKGGYEQRNCFKKIKPEKPAVVLSEKEGLFSKDSGAMFGTQESFAHL